MVLPSDQEVLGSVPGSAMEFFCSGELFHGMYGLVVSVFQCPLCMLSSVLFLEKVPAFCLPQVRGSPPVMYIFLYVVHRKLQTL